MVVKKSTKKRSVLLSLCIIGLLSNNTPVLASDYYETNDYSAYSNFYYDPNADFKLSLYQHYIKLPDYIKQIISDGEMNIHITGDLLLIEDIYRLGNTNWVSGITDVNNNDIYIESSLNSNIIDKFMVSDTYLEYGNNLSQETVTNVRSLYVMYHEVGHYLDWLVTGYNYEDYINKLRDTEILELSSSQLYKIALFDRDTNELDTAEYLAAAYAFYNLCPWELKNKCPDTYTYLYFRDLYFKNNPDLNKNKPKVL